MQDKAHVQTLASLAESGALASSAVCLGVCLRALLCHFPRLCSVEVPTAESADLQWKEVSF